MLWLIFSQEVVLAKHHWKHLVQDYVAKFLPEMQIRNFESATKAIERPINLRNCFNGCIKKNSQTNQNPIALDVEVWNKVRNSVTLEGRYFEIEKPRYDRSEKRE